MILLNLILINILYICLGLISKNESCEKIIPNELSFGPTGNTIGWIYNRKFPPKVPCQWDLTLSQCQMNKTDSRVPVHITNFHVNMPNSIAKKVALHSIISPCAENPRIRCVAATEACIVVLSSHSDLKLIWKQNLLLLQPTLWKFQNLDWPAPTFIIPPKGAVALSAFYQGSNRFPCDMQVPLLRIAWYGSTGRLLSDLLETGAVERKLLLSFQGSIFNYNLPWERHRQLIAELDDPERGVIINLKCGCKVSKTTENETCLSHFRHPDYNMSFLIKSSKFGLVPGGGGAHSYRFLETLFGGSIPVMIDEYMAIPPFGTEERALSINWTSCVVIVKVKELSSLPDNLRNISDEEYYWRKAQCKDILDRWFLEKKMLAFAFYKSLHSRIL